MPLLSGFDVLLILSKLFAVGTAVIMYLLVRKVSHQSNIAVLSVLFLLSFYGFWRYANIPEFYTAASFISILIVYLAYTWKIRFKAAALAFLSVVAVSFHISTVAVTCWALPVYMLFTRQYKLLLYYLLWSLPLTIITYTVFFRLADPELAANLVQWVRPPSSGTSGAFGIATLVKPFIGYGQAILSSNFLFAFASFRQLMASKFPGNMLDEEFFLGSHMSALAADACVVLTILLVLAVVLLVLKIIRHWKKKNVQGISLIIIGVSWLLGNAAITLNSASSNPELWIIAAVPTVFILAFFITNYYKEAKGVFIAVLVMMLLHTTINASFLNSRSSDYYFQEYELVKPHLHDGDIIVTLDKGMLTRYLQYNLLQKVVVVNFFGKKPYTSRQEWKTIYDTNKEVYAFESVFKMPDYYQHTRKELSDSVEAINQEHFKDFVLYDSNEISKLYKLQKPLP